MLGTLGVLSVRCGGCGDLDGGGARAGGGRGDTPLGLPDASLSRCIVAVSIDCDRGPSVLIAGSDRAGSALLVEPQCCESMDRLSSIGVNIIWDLAWAGNGFG
jgi:hypothetical protein